MICVLIKRWGNQLYVKNYKKQMAIKMNQDAQIELEKTLFTYWNQTTWYTRVSWKISKHGNNSKMFWTCTIKWF
jgi:hypothetical protein